jgi:hypothetical protein
VSDHDSHGRIRYQYLTPDEREALHAWVRLHNVDHTIVPVDPLIEYDPTTDEYRIETFALRNGWRYAIGDEIAKAVVRRRRKADLPWRTT